MVDLIGDKTGARRPLLALPPSLALLSAETLSLFVGDVLLRLSLQGIQTSFALGCPSVAQTHPFH